MAQVSAAVSHLLRRVGFGVGPEERARFGGQSYAAAVDALVNYDPATADIVRSSVTSTNTPVTRDVPLAPAETEIINRYNTFLGPIANTVVGYIGGTILGRGCTVLSGCTANTCS